MTQRDSVPLNPARDSREHSVLQLATFPETVVKRYSFYIHLGELVTSHYDRAVDSLIMFYAVFVTLSELGLSEQWLSEQQRSE